MAAADAKADSKAQDTLKLNHTTPKLCKDGCLGKQERKFKPKQTKQLQLSDLSIILCFAVILPISYILFFGLH